MVKWWFVEQLFCSGFFYIALFINWFRFSLERQRSVAGEAGCAILSQLVTVLCSDGDVCLKLKSDIILNSANTGLNSNKAGQARCVG